MKRNIFKQNIYTSAIRVKKQYEQPVPGYTGDQIYADTEIMIEDGRYIKGKYKTMVVTVTTCDCVSQNAEKQAMLLKCCNISFNSSQCHLATFPYCRPLLFP